MQQDTLHTGGIKDSVLLEFLNVIGNVSLSDLSPEMQRNMKDVKLEHEGAAHVQLNNVHVWQLCSCSITPGAAASMN